MLALIVTVRLATSVESILTGPVNVMPIAPILTSISALTASGLSTDFTRAPGTHGTSVPRSLMTLHA